MRRRHHESPVPIELTRLAEALEACAHRYAVRVGGRWKAERSIAQLIAGLAANPDSRRLRMAAFMVLRAGGFDPSDFPEIAFEIGRHDDEPPTLGGGR